MRNRNIQMKIWLSSGEQKALKKSAGKTGLSVGTYVRKLVSGYEPKELPPLEYYDLMRELRAIGNNMRQIAARANTTGFFMAEEYEKNSKALTEAILRIEKAMTVPEKSS